MKNIFTLTLLFFLFQTFGLAQGGMFSNNKINYEAPRKFEIGGIVVDGAVITDVERIISFSGLQRGKEITIPGSDISNAIKKLWDVNNYSDINIYADRIVGNTIFLRITLKERNRMSKYQLKGVTNSQAKTLKESLGLYGGKLITESLLDKTKFICKDYFVEKGYLNTSVNITSIPDTMVNNAEILIININKGQRIKINEIIIEGNDLTKQTKFPLSIFKKETKVFSDRKIKRTLKDTKEKSWLRFWKRSKFEEEKYESEKQQLIAKYNSMAMRDAKIVFDTIYTHDPSSINIKMKISEGNKYYFRDINWVGNTKYSTGKLDTILGIKRGDEYNKQKLESKLYMSQSELDISSLYMDKGHLFFQITPIEKTVENDSIDIDILLYEGKIAIIDEITIVGNTKTNEHVIRRELRTKPGMIFSRADIIRSQRELSNLGYFDPERMGVNPTPNPTDGTVDIEYIVAEKPSDQIELSGGWGGGQFVGSLGLSFTNFSMRNFFEKESWSPLPTGDGQRLSLRGSANIFFQSLSLSFTEPWLGGKKPTSFSVNAYYSLQKLSQLKRSDPLSQTFDVLGAAIGLGTRLKVPDDFFTAYGELGYEYYTLNNYNLLDGFNNGFANNLSFKFTLSRNSVDQPIYPRSGSEITMSFKTTAPYSWFDGRDDYSDLTSQEKFKWIEYNKIKFVAKWYTPVSKDRKFVLHSSIGFGFLNSWSKNKGVSPFERFFYGGSGLTGFRLAGREYIALRGYDDNSISSQGGDALISKYKVELRYPISLNPSATVFALVFGEAGNSWNSFSEYNPFEVKKSAGVGLRLFLPMFGLIGLDYGWGLDPLTVGDSGYRPALHSPGNFTPQGQFHFTIGMNIGEL
ncbi:MAG: outer membrane protein assembly factor BamA [Flavobacteriales bacterium]